MSLPIPDATAEHRIELARAHGIVNPLITWQEAKIAAIPFALACAILDQESGGGRNEFGHDPTICIGWGSVTWLKYKAYKAKRLLSRNRLMQGVGPCQLTWYAYQDKADTLGGCWKPRWNMRTGFGLLAYNIRRYGLEAGVRAYNGTGPAADAYAKSVLAKFATWRTIVG